MNYIETYSELIKFKPIGLRGRLRNITLDLLSIAEKIQGREPYLQKPRIQFLYIHHTFKDEEKKLDVLLKKLAANHTFISHSEAVTKILNSDVDKPYIAISSDDGFRNNVQAGEILKHYGVKGCFFVNPALIQETNYERITRHCAEKLHFPPVEFLTWPQVEQLQKAGHEIGSHTMDHVNVAKTPIDEFYKDMYKTAEILKRRCGEAKHFAYPYGRFFHFNEAARRAVFETGFISCATAERGCHINPGSTLRPDELCIRRDHVILDWKLDHVLHFITNNSKKANTANNLFPFNP